MEHPKNLKEVFREAGLRWTPQRQAIAEALSGSTRHPTAEEIYEDVRDRFPGMSRATVYNTMEALAAIGEIETIHSGDGPRRYDPNPVPHHHLRCRGCGRIVDLPADKLPKLPRLPGAMTEGFRIHGYRIEFHGDCARCEARRPRSDLRTKGNGGQSRRRNPKEESQWRKN